MKIDLKSRMRNKTFLVAMFAAVSMLIQSILEPFGVDVTILNEAITNVFNAALVLLIIIGVVIDPVTPGIKDKK